MSDLKPSQRETSAILPRQQPHPPSPPISAHGAERPTRRKRARIPGDASARFVDAIARRRQYSSDDGDALLTSIVLDAAELLGASRVAMMLYDPRDESVEILDVGAPAFPGRIVKLGEGVAGRVIESGQPLVVPDYQGWPGKISGEVLGPPIVSAVAVPLRNGDVSVGAITAHSTDPERRFTDRDAHVLEVFADIAMLALSHFSMSAELRTLNTHLEKMVQERTSALEQSTEEISRKNEQLEELLAAVAQAQNEERWRIAQDIHDGIMQTLAGAIFELKALETSSSGSAVTRMRNVRDLLHQLEVGLRGVIQNLQPVELERGGLVEAVQDEARHLRTRYGIECRVRVFGEQGTLPQPVESTALRIVEEALRNVQLHAFAARAEVEIHYLEPDLQVCIRDFGRGFEPDVTRDARPHFGISGMRRRAEALGGSFALRSAPGRGTAILATIPGIER
jgi:signal transduction histidine kinase